MLRSLDLKTLLQKHNWQDYILVPTYNRAKERNITYFCSPRVPHESQPVLVRAHLYSPVFKNLIQRFWYVSVGRLSVWISVQIYAPISLWWPYLYQQELRRLSVSVRILLPAISAKSGRLLQWSCCTSTCRTTKHEREDETKTSQSQGAAEGL